MCSLLTVNLLIYVLFIIVVTSDVYGINDVVTVFRIEKQKKTKTKKHLQH